MGVCLSICRRLNGSSSSVLTTKSRFYGNAEYMTPTHNIKTPEPIGIKFGSVDYVREMTPPCAKFHADSSIGGLWQMGEI